MKEYFTWLAKTITLLVLIFVFVPVVIGALIAAASTSVVSKVGVDNKGVAVIDLKGEIIDTSKQLKELYEKIADDKVIGVVLNIDSPGGAVAPSQQIYTAVKSLKEKKPIVAVMNSMAASGGLYAAVGASKVLAQPGTLTGSIGVILQLPNLEKIADMVGFQMVTIKSGELKDVGNAFRAVTEKDREFLQTSVNRVKDDFIAAVAEGRNLSKEQVSQIADGRFILGSEALDLGLIDSFGTIYDGATMVYELAKVDLPENKVPNIFMKDDKLERIVEILESSTLVTKILSMLSPSYKLS